MPIKQNQIAQMAGNMPQALGMQVNQASAQQATNLQQAIAAAPVGQPTQQAGQQMAAQQAAQTGQTQVAATQQGNQAQADAGKQLLQQSGVDAQQRMQRKAVESQKQNREAQATLANLSGELKNKLFDSNMTFQKDEMGRTLYNDQQLLDFKLAQGMSDEALAGYEQQVRQTGQRKMQLLQTVQAKLKQELANSFSQGQQALDQEQQKFLIEKQRQVNAKIKSEKAKAANRAAAFSAAGTVIGAVVGGVATMNPAGAMAGASAGGALGSAAAAS